MSKKEVFTDEELTKLVDVTGKFALSFSHCIDYGESVTALKFGMYKHLYNELIEVTELGKLQYMGQVKDMSEDEAKRLYALSQLAVTILNALGISFSIEDPAAVAMGKYASDNAKTLNDEVLSRLSKEIMRAGKDKTDNAK